MSGGEAPAFVYLGSSDFAATVLRGLVAASRRPALVVTPPDRGRGRGRRLSPPPAASAAAELGLDLHQTGSVNEEASREVVLGAGAELAVVCAFGQLVGAELLAALPMLNAHPSLLPRWRGAAPIERALLAGDERTGTCVMRITEGLDAGPVALRTELPIGVADTYGSLAPALAAASAELLAEALGLWAAGELEPRFHAQDEAGVTYAEKLARADRLVDPARPAAAEERRIRALTPHIGAAVELADGERLGVRSAGLASDGPDPGRFAATGEGLLLGCAGGAIRLAEVQPAGGRWMAAAEYLRGRGLPAGAR